MLVDYAPVDDQLSRGLRWVGALVTPRPHAIAGHTFLLAWWLERLRERGPLGDDGELVFQQIVDGLVAAGDSRALRLQMAIER